MVTPRLDFVMPSSPGSSESPEKMPSTSPSCFDLLPPCVTGVFRVCRGEERGLKSYMLVFKLFIPKQWDPQPVTACGSGGVTWLWPPAQAVVKSGLLYIQNGEENQEYRCPLSRTIMPSTGLRVYHGAAPLGLILMSQNARTVQSSQWSLDRYKPCSFY